MMKQQIELSFLGEIKNGKLVGITGRYNFNDLGKYPKWKALKNFSKGNYLYGIFENYENIKNAGYVLIGESEKFVMQLDTMGLFRGMMTLIFVC